MICSRNTANRRLDRRDTERGGMEEDKEKVCLAVSVHAKAGLDRLARHYKITKAEVFEKLIKEADLNAAEKAFKSGGARAEKAYYEPTP